MGYDDDSLFFKRIQDGDEEAYHKLVSLMNKQLFNIAYDILQNEDDSNDAVMATYEALFQNRDLLKYPKGIKSWLCVTATRKAYDIIRSNKRMIFMDQDAILDVECAAASTDDKHNNDISDKFLVYDCLNKLPPTQRDVLLLKFCGYPNRVITNITGLTAAKIKLAYKKAQKAFIDYFKAKDKYPD